MRVICVHFHSRVKCYCTHRRLTTLCTRSRMTDGILVIYSWTFLCVYKWVIFLLRLPIHYRSFRKYRLVTAEIHSLYSILHFVFARFSLWMLIKLRIIVCLKLSDYLPFPTTYNPPPPFNTISLSHKNEMIYHKECKGVP